MTILMYLLFGFVAGLALISYIFWERLVCDVIQREDPRNNSVTEQIPLTKISQIWVESNLPTKETQSVPVEPTLVTQQFKHNEIKDFYYEINGRLPNLKKTHRVVILKLLEILDNLGDCPSVVCDGAPVENDYSILNNLNYNILALVPLWKHSLNVAKKIQEGQSSMLVPSRVICALGHDIGKIPQFRDKHYVTGDHPLISLIVLSGLPDYCSLPDHEEIDLAIKYHHIPNPRQGLTKLLKASDCYVRDRELIDQSLLLAQSNVIPEEVFDFKKKMRNDPKWGMELLDCPGGSKNREPLADPFDIYDDRANQKGYRPKIVDISSWWDANQVMLGLRKAINRVSRNKWESVSSPEGLVYFGQDTLWNVLKTVSHQNSILLLAEAFEADKRDILFSAVWALDRELGAIATELLDKKYYMCPVCVFSGSGKELSSKESPFYLIPFKTDAFGVLPSKLEQEKSITIRRMVKQIKPRMVDAGYQYGA